MLNLVPTYLVALSTLITSLSALAWSFRRKP